MSEYKTIFEFVSNQGIAISTTVGVMAIAYKYINKMLNDNTKTYIEILNALNLITDKIINNYSKKETIILLTRMRARSLLEEYKSKILMYIINNNIKINLKTIKIEIEAYQKESITKTKELLQDETNISNIEIIVNELKNTFNRIDEVILPIFDELAQEKPVCEMMNNLLREVDKHFEREIAISIQRIMDLKFN